MEEEKEIELEKPVQKSFFSDLFDFHRKNLKHLSYLWSFIYTYFTLQTKNIFFLKQD